jgi:hypothetical protein
MSTTLNGFGLIPKYNLGGTIRPRAYESGILSGYATAIYKYQPVALNSSGNIVVGAASGADIIGVFAGWDGVDSNGKFWNINNWSANQTYITGEIMNAYIWDDPNTVYRIQADGSLAQSFGGQVNFTSATVGNGNSTTGLSQCTASAASLSTSAQAMLRIIECPNLQESGGNSWGDAYTTVDVMIARHQYIANKVAV